jgi:hypothetical protein
MKNVLKRILNKVKTVERNGLLVVGDAVGVKIRLFWSRP